jgi:hypothetical protein
MTAVAMPIEAQVCGRSLAGTAGSDPAQGMDACLLYRPLRRADPLCRGVLPSVCVCVTQCDQVQQYLYTYREVGGRGHINPLTPNDHYSGRAVSLTSQRCILYIYSTNIGTEYFKHGLYSPFFSFKMQFVS